MNKITFAVAVSLLAAPAWATTVTVWCEHIQATYQVEIWYETDGTLPRAFGLDITVDDYIGPPQHLNSFTDEQARIIACEPAIVGESTAAAKGNGVFPGTITIDAAGNVTDYGSPVAPQSDLPGDTLGGLGTSGITIELGSSYIGESNAPDPRGLLCTLTVSQECAIGITANVSRAGYGVILEDADEIPTVTFRTCVVYFPGCVIPGMTDCCGHTVTAAEYAMWISLGRPTCWCDPCHCRGDANGDCIINAVDALTLRNAWPALGGAYNPCVDTDYSGGIAAVDALALRNAWPGAPIFGPGCSGCPPCP